MWSVPLLQPGAHLGHDHAELLLRAAHDVERLAQVGARDRWQLAGIDQVVRGGARAASSAA